MKLTKFSLNKLISYQENQITSRMLSDTLQTVTPIAMYALAAGESISEESTCRPKLVHIIDGFLEITISEESYFLETGEMLVIPMNTIHEISANAPCKFLQIELEEKAGEGK